MSEGLLGGRDESGPPLPHLPLVLLHVVISLVVSAVAPLGDIAHNRRIAVLWIYNLEIVNLVFIGYNIIKLNSSNIILWLQSPALPIALIEFHWREKDLQSCSLMGKIRLVFSLLMRLLMTLLSGQRLMLLYN